MKRMTGVLCCLLLLATTARAASAGYVLTVKNGYICVREARSAQWVQETRIRADSLCDYDRLLLEKGLFLQNKAEYTSALEDFCS